MKLTKEQVKDFTLLADALAANNSNNEIIHGIGAKYKDFIEENFAELDDGVRIDNLVLGLKRSTKLIVRRVGGLA